MSLRRITGAIRGRLIRFILFLMMVSYVPLIFAVIAGLGFAGYKLTLLAFDTVPKHRGGMYLAFIALSIDIAILGVAIMLIVGLVPLLFRQVHTPEDGLPLNREENKTLFELIDRFCGRLKCKSPQVVLLTPTDMTAISSSWVTVEGAKKPRKVRALFLGAGHIVHLRADEFLTVLCHELAHEAVGDTWFSRVIARFFNSMSAAIEYQDNPNAGRAEQFAATVLTGYFHVFALLYTADCRHREFRVDRIAARICGAQNVRNTLMKLHLPDLIQRLSLDALFTEFAMTGEPIRNVYEEYRNRWAMLKQAEVERAQTQMFLDRHDIWSTHPCLADRMRNLADIESKELILDKPAMRLFANWPRHEELITKFLVSVRRFAIDKHLDFLDRELRHQPRG